MKILILSDIHLGNPLFNDHHRLNNLLESEEFDSLVLNGDILDVWEKSLFDIVDENEEFIWLINGLSEKMDVIYVIGNHDPSREDLVELFPNVKVVEEYIFDKKTIFTHGQIYDEFIIDHSKWARFLYCIQWVFERVGINLQACCRNTLHSIAMKREKKYYNDLVFDIENEATVSNMERGYNNIVLGHTHLPKLVDNYHDVIYVNSGDWIHNRTYAEYNTDDNKFTIYGVDGEIKEL